MDFPQLELEETHRQHNNLNEMHVNDWALRVLAPNSNDLEICV